jgi:histidinol-phosphate aminotransferase
MPVRPNIFSMQGYIPGEQPRGQEFIKLNTNENPYPCSPQVKAAIGRVLQVGLQRYPDPLASAFRERAAEVLSVEAPCITPDWILCGNGSDDLLTIIMRTFVDAGDLVRFPRPSYILYGTLAGIQGAASQTVDYQPDWSLGADFTEPEDRLRLAFLANPNSPSGTSLPPAEVAHLAAALPCPLVVDEAYADFAESNCLTLTAENDRVFVTRSLSKSYALAGLRFGYVVAQPHIIAQLNKVKDSYNCDSLSIAGAVAAIEDRAWFDRARAAVSATRERMTAELRQRAFTCVDSQANFVWCRHETANSQELYRRLKSEGILVRYMIYPGWGDGLRISVGTDDQVDILLSKLCDLLAS